jgi:hypothetical protein
VCDGTIEDASMADKQKKAVPDQEPSHPSYAVPRREQRYPVTAVYQRYVSLKVKIDDVFVPVILHNFSGNGVLFESSVPFEIGSHADCAISISQSLSREISFAIRVKRCQTKSNTFLVGAVIETVADATWFRVFKEVHDYIVQRKGDVY